MLQTTAHIRPRDRARREEMIFEMESIANRNRHLIALFNLYSIAQTIYMESAIARNCHLKNGLNSAESCQMIDEPTDICGRRSSAVATLLSLSTDPKQIDPAGCRMGIRIITVHNKTKMLRFVSRRPSKRDRSVCGHNTSIRNGKMQ